VVEQPPLGLQELAQAQLATLPPQLTGRRLHGVPFPGARITSSNSLSSCSAVAASTCDDAFIHFGVRLTGNTSCTRATLDESYELRGVVYGDFDRVIVGQFGARGMVEGPNFAFGRDRGGDARLLADWCSAAGLDFAMARPIEVDGQLVSSSQARDTEHAILGLAGTDAPTAADLARLSPAQMRSRGLATHRASALLRLLRTSDFERLRDVPTPVVIRRLTREPGFGPWSCGVVCLEGLGRYDHGKVGDLGFIKLVSALRGRWVEAEETAEFLAPYGEWQGLAYSYLMAGWALGLVPGADRDGWRLPRQQANRAA